MLSQNQVENITLKKLKVNWEINKENKLGDEKITIFGENYIKITIDLYYLHYRELSLSAVSCTI